MTATSINTDSKNPAASTPPLATFGPVHRDVIDRDRSLTWWRDVVGLQLVADHADSVERARGSRS